MKVVPSGGLKVEGGRFCWSFVPDKETAPSGVTGLGRKELKATGVRDGECGGLTGLRPPADDRGRFEGGVGDGGGSLFDTAEGLVGCLGAEIRCTSFNTLKISSSSTDTSSDS